MSNTIEHLVAMANDIGAFFDGEVGPGESPASIAQHLQRYWDPRMRAQIIAHATTGGAELSPSARAAVKMLPTPAAR
jgi:formate dehydrogenase subunit delta